MLQGFISLRRSFVFQNAVLLGDEQAFDRFDPVDRVRRHSVGNVSHSRSYFQEHRAEGTLVWLEIDSEGTQTEEARCWLSDASWQSSMLTISTGLCY